jgi:hypothetical protein
MYTCFLSHLPWVNRTNLCSSNTLVQYAPKYTVLKLAFVFSFQYCIFWHILCKYYVSGHFSSSCLIWKHHPVYFSKHNVSETGFCLRLQVKPTQLGTIDRASPYLRTPVPAPRWGIWARHSTNHLRELGNGSDMPSSQTFTCYLVTL